MSPALGAGPPVSRSTGVIDEAAELLSRLPAEDAAPIFERLDDEEQGEIVGVMPPESVAHIASEMAPDDRADLFSLLPEALGDKVLVELDRVDPEAAEDVRELEQWPATSAGHLMTTSFVSVAPDVAVADAIQAVQVSADGSAYAKHESEAQALADRVAIIKEGRILAVGSPLELGVRVTRTPSASGRTKATP